MTGKRQFTGDIIYTQIKKKIIELEFSPEKPMSEEGLTSEFGVSRTPLRQALLRLELEGLIHRQPNGRLQVAPVSIQEAEEIFKVREVLEGLIAREATKNITKDQLIRLEDTLELMIRAAEAHRNSDTIRYGSEFHHMLYEPSQNQTAVHFLDQLKSRLERYRRLGGYRNPKYEPMHPVKEHQDLFLAIQQGNVDLAEQVMRAHIRRSLNVAIDTLQMSSTGEKSD